MRKNARNCAYLTLLRHGTQHVYVYGIRNDADRKREAKMKTEKLTGTIESAYGKKLDKPVNYEGTFEAYENVGEVRSANDMPSDDEVVSFRNTQKRNNTRQRLMQEALDKAGIVKPTLENSEELRYKNIYDALIAAGKSVTEAESIAKAALS